MPLSHEDLPRIEALHTAVTALTELAVAEKDWKPTAETVRFMEDVEIVTGPHLPAQALKSGTVALAFLLAAKATLEVRLRQLDPDVD